MSNAIKSYKGMDKDMRCFKGKFQYEIGKSYETEEAKACECGFHACENPLSVFEYFPPSDSRYFEVIQEGEMDNAYKKIASSKITIKSEIKLSDFIDTHINKILKDQKIKKPQAKDNDDTSADYLIVTDADRPVAINNGDYSAAVSISDNSLAINTGASSAAANIGYYSVATDSGDYSTATNTGEYSAASASGYYSIAADTGNGSAATNAGNCSVAVCVGSYSIARNAGNYSIAVERGYHSTAINTGNSSVALNAGDQSTAENNGRQSIAVNQGYHSTAINTGNRSVAINVGDYSQSSVSGMGSIAIATGMHSKAKADLGSAIIIIERNPKDKDDITAIKAFVIDGKKYKPNVWYTLENGKVVTYDEES